jgi:hypothetical protein
VIALAVAGCVAVFSSRADTLQNLHFFIKHFRINKKDRRFFSPGLQYTLNIKTYFLK